MTDSNPLRFLALALIAVGLADLVGFVVEPILSRQADLGVYVLGIPVGAALLFGRTRWIRPALLLLQVGSVVLTLVMVAAIVGALPVPAFPEADLSGFYRPVALALVVVQGALWVGGLGLGRRAVSSWTAA